MSSGMTEEERRAAKRPKRTYRACHPCRSRKLKCSFGDPNMPWDGPCERCMRESRECERSKPTFVRAPRPRKSDARVVSPSRPNMPAATPRGEPASYRSSPIPPHLPRSRSRAASPSHSGSSDDDADPRETTNPLVSSKLQNPSDALRLLATASSVQYHALESTYPPKQRNSVSGGINTSAWESWAPIQQGLLTVADARQLFGFFEMHMAALFPLIHPMLFSTEYLETLVRDESLLLGTILAIASRYSNVLPNNRGQMLHDKLAQWVRLEFMHAMDGEPSLRSISTVEALLLLSEWPMKRMRHHLDPGAEPESEELQLLKPSLRYDAYSWSTIGWAVRLAQELGIHKIVKHSPRDEAGLVSNWKEERMLKTWIYCCNADRHVAVRLGRSAMLQEVMTSRWWEDLSDQLNNDTRGDSHEVWTSDVFMLACIAQLLGTVQDQLYAHKEVTRSLLRTGTWEAFLRRLSLEISYSKDACQGKLTDGTVDSALLRIEFDYVVLYAYSLTLRALQAKLRRRRQANDRYYRAPSLLNLIEGPWIMEALHAARSIIDITLNVLESRDILRYVPSRCFHYCLFATTFMYKALASGMVEYGQTSTAALLDQVVQALQRASIDDEHFLSGFAGLLGRLGKHWSGEPTSGLSPVLHAERGREQGPAAPPAPVQQLYQPQFQAPNLETLLAIPPPAGGAQGDVAPQGPAEPPAAPYTPLDVGAGMPGLPDDFHWNFDPTSQMPDADHEQDVLFQSIWDTGGDDVTGSASNLYATLLGDVFSFPEGLDGGY